MFIVSTPSLALYVVLAIFYVANLIVFAANHFQEAEISVETTINFDQPANQFSQHTILLHAGDDIRYHDNSCDSSSGNFCFLWRFDHVAFIHDYLCHAIQDVTPGKPEQGIYYQLFFRPPPIIG